MITFPKFGSVVLMLISCWGVLYTGTDKLVMQGKQTMIAGPQYSAGGLQKFFMGSHYREEWTTPVSVNILDLKRSAGGLIPVKKSGGGQSKSLLFLSGDGGKYQFRSIDKDPSRALPSHLRESVMADILRDQTSTAHPFAFMVIPPLAEAAGILHTNPRLVALPDNPELGEFREDFAGTLGSVEEFVAHGPDNSPGFAGYRHIVSTQDVLKILEEDFQSQVDQRAYLKARLLDILISDWDRHFDQWRWAEVRTQNQRKWLPVPIDRDQAFVKFDGLLPSIAEDRTVVPQFEGIEKENPDIWSLTFQGRHIDHLFLNKLTRNDFQQVTNDFIAKITNEVISRAVKQLPPSIYQISGPELTRILKHRRDLLENAAMDYYANLAEIVKITGRNKSEILKIVSRVDRTLEIFFFESDSERPAKNPDTLYHRIFFPGQTKEIRIYLFGGDDKVLITGSTKNNITLRIIGGSGADELTDRSRAKVIFYDTEFHTSVSKGERTIFKKGRVDSVINTHQYQPMQLSHGHFMRTIPIVGFNPDDGFVVGAGLDWTHYGFRKYPFARKYYLNASYSFKTSSIRSELRTRFTDVLKNMDLNVNVNISPRRINNFFGLGNDSRKVKELENEDFYRTQTDEYIATVGLSSHLSKNSSLSAEGSIQWIQTDLEAVNPTFISDQGPYGVDLINTARFTSGLIMDFRDDPVFARKGTYMELGASIFPKALDNDSTFIKGSMNTRFFLNPVQKLILSLNIKGEKIWGAFPYYEASYMGGDNMLIGFPRRRFGGDAGLYGGLALRYHLFSHIFLLPFDFGWLVFGETGRVWLKGDSPGIWHSNVGTGFWYTPAIKELSVHAVIARSDEDIRFVFSGNFIF